MAQAITISKQSSTVKFQNPVAAPTSTVITNDEIVKLIAAQEDKAAINRAAAKAEKEYDKLLVGLFEKLFGIKTKDEIKAISPDVLGELFQAGIGDSFVLEPGLDFKVTLSKEAAYPSWRSEFVKLTSEAAAQEVADNTPLQYSYKITKD